MNETVTECSCLARIAAACESAKQANTELCEAVTAARDAGEPWTRIATVLGTSRQAAQQRFGEETPCT